MKQRLKKKISARKQSEKQNKRTAAAAAAAGAETTAAAAANAMAASPTPATACPAAEAATPTAAADLTAVCAEACAANDNAADATATAAATAAAPPLSMPRDEDLPPVFREIVSNAPANRKLAAFLAAASPLCALATRVRLNYFYDNHPSALLLQVYIEGPQSCGKAYCADIVNLIMENTLSARDDEQRRKEQTYRERKKARRSNEKIGEAPVTVVLNIPPTISKTMLVHRADMCTKTYAAPLTFFMFAEELAQVTDAGKQGYSNLRTIMRTAYDLGSKFGIDFAGENSYSATVDINICSLFCCTPAALDDYFDKASVEGGNITRSILCHLDDEIGAEGIRFRRYSAEQRAAIQAMLSRMMDDTYAPDGTLRPEQTLDMDWMEEEVRRFITAKGTAAALSGSVAMDVFRKRSSVSAFRIAALAYYLYGLEDKPDEETRRAHCRQIYRFMAEYVFGGLLDKWGSRFELLDGKRREAERCASQPKLFNMLGDVFTRKQLSDIIFQHHFTTPARTFLHVWRQRGFIEPMDNDTFCKLHDA